MSVPFNSTPSDLLIPFFPTEFDSSRAEQGPATLSYTAGIIGQKISGGTWTANTWNRATNADQVATGAGRGSCLHRQALAWFSANKATEAYFGVLDDNGAGTAASGKVVFAGTATEARTFYAYFGGDRVPVPVAVGDDAAAVAAALVAEMADYPDLAITAAVDGSVDEEVDFTHRHKGAFGTEFDIRLNYNDGEALPAGITATITAMASGATNPTMTTLLAAASGLWFNVLSMPYTDATSLSAMEAELLARFGPMRAQDGVCYTAKADTHGNLGTLGDGRNSPFVSIAESYKHLRPPAEVAANIAAQVALSAQNQPNKPMQNLPLGWCLPPAHSDRFDLEERQLLLEDGISTLKVQGSTVYIERLITTYKENAAGAADFSYRPVEVLHTLMYLRHAWKTHMASRYPRALIADDGAAFPEGVQVLTPNGGRAEAVAWFMDMQDLLLVEGLEQFKRDLVVERSGTERMNFLLPPDLINQLIVVATNMQFRV